MFYLRCKGTDFCHRAEFHYTYKKKKTIYMLTEDIIKESLYQLFFYNLWERYTTCPRLTLM